MAKKVVRILLVVREPDSCLVYQIVSEDMDMNVPRRMTLNTCTTRPLENMQLSVYQNNTKYRSMEDCA